MAEGRPPLLIEGYYEGDRDTLRTMQQLVQEIRRFRETAESDQPSEILSSGDESS